MTAIIPCSKETLSIDTGGWLALCSFFFGLPAQSTGFSALFERQNTYRRSNSKLFSLFRETSPF